LLPDYLKVAETLGFRRIVLVQPSMHGTDNTVMLAALETVRAQGIDCFAIAGITPVIRDNELKLLHESGVRGVRLNMIYRGGEAANIDSTAQLAARLRELGWCLEILVDVSLL